MGPSDMFCCVLEGCTALYKIKALKLDPGAARSSPCTRELSQLGN